MNPREELLALEELLDQLIRGIQDVLQSGEVLSDEFQGMMAREIGLTTQRIDQLKQEQANQPQQPQARQSIEPRASIDVIPSADAQLLWILAGQQEDAFLHYLQSYPTPATQNLLRNPVALEQTIQALHQMMPSGQPPAIDDIQHSHLNSSTVWGTAYNPKTKQMKVRFQNGDEYEYEGVPVNIYRAFSNGQASAKTKGSNQFGAWWPLKSPSIGAALNQYIKAGGFPYQKVA